MQELSVFAPVDVVLFRRVNSLQVDVSYPSAFSKKHVASGLILRFYPWLHGDLIMKSDILAVVHLCSSFHNQCLTWHIHSC